MLAKKAVEKFQEGAFGKIYSKELIEQIEALREQAGAAQCQQIAHFDLGAEDGETIIQVSLILKVKGQEIEE